MPIPIERSFANAARRPVLAFPSWLRRSSGVRPKQIPIRRFSIPSFDADNERLFWQEHQTETLSTLKTALPLAAICFSALVALDLFNYQLAPSEVMGRLLIPLSLSILFFSLLRYSKPENRINSAVKLSAALSVVELGSFLFIKHNPAFYAEIWVGLLPVYFFIYGQLFMTIVETLAFGLLAMAALLLSGHFTGVDAEALMPSMIILLIVNAFGFCTRCQLEVHARHLFQERRKAECNLEDKTLFLRQLSHNLCQPLRALSCYSSILDTAVADQSGDSLQQMLDRMNLAIDELSNTLTHILDIANLETGRQTPQLAAVDLNALLTALANRFAPQAEKRGLKLKIRLRSRPPHAVYSDACMLDQIVSNLIDNAIKYTVRGWVVVTAVNVGGNRLKLHVCDSGTGISDKLRNDIFKESFRGHRRQTDSCLYGQGIGLAYVLKTVEHLPEHSLDFYSKSNYGSDFQLYLPAAAEQPCLEPLSANTNDNLAGSFVFIVDYNQEVLDALSEQLIRWGCLVQKARTKAETLTTLSDLIRPPDLLITDFYLDGNETALGIIAAIQADCGTVPTLILSAHTIPKQEKEKLPENIQLLRKPADAPVLMETMVKAMGMF